MKVRVRGSKVPRFDKAYESKLIQVRVSRYSRITDELRIHSFGVWVLDSVKIIVKFRNNNKRTNFDVCNDDVDQEEKKEEVWRTSVIGESSFRTIM